MLHTSVLSTLSLTAALLSFGTAVEARDGRKEVSKLRVRVLSTMLADDGIGEWGFAAHVEVDDHPILFDTGARPRTVLDNARELGIDLSRVETVVLSHHHADHVGGLLTLRRELRAGNPSALSIVHVARGMFRPRRYRPGDPERNEMIEIRRSMEESGASFVIHDRQAEILPGVWLTGPVDRRHPERNWSGRTEMVGEAGWSEDTIPESQSLVAVTSEGLVVVSGCGHAGIVNTVEHARRVVRDVPIHAALGGFHLFRATDDHLRWTGERLQASGLRQLLGAHCTGIEAVFQLRESAALERRTCAVAAVGSDFVLGQGLDPGALAR